MFKRVKKFVNKNKTAYLALAVIALSLSVGLSIPSAVNPNISMICIDNDCEATERIKDEATKKATIRRVHQYLQEANLPDPQTDDDIDENDGLPPLDEDAIDSIDRVQNPRPPSTLPDTPSLGDLLPDDECWADGVCPSGKYCVDGTCRIKEVGTSYEELGRRCLNGIIEISDNQGNWYSLGRPCDPSKPSYIAPPSTTDIDDACGDCDAGFACTRIDQDTTACFSTDDDITCEDDNYDKPFADGFVFGKDNPGSFPKCSTFETGRPYSQAFVKRTCVNGDWQSSYADTPNDGCESKKGCRDFSENDFNASGCCEKMKGQSDFDDYSDWCREGGDGVEIKPKGSTSGKKGLAKLVDYIGKIFKDLGWF